MFGDLFGNVEQQQKELQEKLSKIEVSGEAGDGAIRIVCTLFFLTNVCNSKIVQ